jgi:hypothetical protein
VRVWIALVVDGPVTPWIVIGLGSLGPDADLGTFELDVYAASTPQSARVLKKASRPCIFLTESTHYAPRSSTISSIFQT